jgi:hypothetical protein
LPLGPDERLMGLEMRVLIALPAILVFGVLGWVWLTTNVFRPAPAVERLSGVAVTVSDYRIEDLPNDAHRLHLTVALTSVRDLTDCVGFTLDEPFAGRRMTPETGVCPTPRAGTTKVSLVLDRLGDDDLTFPSHTVVWGIPGGRCGPVLELFGVCVVEQAGTADLELPNKTVLPTFGPIGSLFPVFSFEAP